MSKSIRGESLGQPVKIRGWLIATALAPRLPIDGGGGSAENASHEGLALDRPSVNPSVTCAKCLIHKAFFLKAREGVARFCRLCPPRRSPRET